MHQLAGRFFTKRTLNVESVAHTFKPLWKPTGELKLRDLGENILLFEFSDLLDLARVLEFEPWTFDKNIVVFREVTEVEEVPSLEFSMVNFGFSYIISRTQVLTKLQGRLLVNLLGKLLMSLTQRMMGRAVSFSGSVSPLTLLSHCRDFISFGLKGSSLVGWGSNTNTFLIFVIGVGV